MFVKADAETAEKWEKMSIELVCISVYSDISCFLGEHTIDRPRIKLCLARQIVKCYSGVSFFPPFLLLVAIAIYMHA